MANDVVAQARIFERLPIPRSSRSRKVLRYTPGNVIPAEEAKRLGVSADGTQSKVPTAESDPSSPTLLADPPKKAGARKAPAKKAKKATKAAKKRG